MQTNQPRGLRNNNPLNIRKSNTPWQGKKINGTDKDFEQFVSLEYGIRAAMVNIRTYLKRDRLQNICQIIAKWAPSSDGNNVEAYINAVCRKATITRAQIIKYNDKNTICRIVWAMAYVECGQEISFGRVCNAWALI